MAKKDAGDTPDMVNAPPHYTQGAVECIDAIKAALGKDGFAAWLRGQVIRYAWRMMHKGTPALDAGKLACYARRLEEETKADG